MTTIRRTIPCKTLCLFALLLISGCGSSQSSGAKANMSTRFAVNGVTSTNSLYEFEGRFLNLRNLLQPGFISYAAGDIGQSGTGTNAITSLQFFVTRIQLCNDLTVSGSGYQNASGCITVFGNEASDNAYDTYKVADAAADTTSSNWIDLMSTTSISNFRSASETDATTGTYNYGIIETRKPFKLNAKFSTENAADLRTCSGGTVTSSGSGESLTETVTVSDMLSCTQGLATIGGQGGGRWFKFQNPVTIDSGKTYVLDLAYNADNAIIGGLLAAGGLSSATYTDGVYGFNYPSLDVSPVLRESSKSTIREEYTVEMSDLNGALVIDLYYAGTTADVGAGAIIGAQTRFVNNATSTGVVYGSAVYSIVTATESIELNNWESKAIVSGLVRSTTLTPGGTQTVTVDKSTLGLSNSTASGSYTATFNGALQM